MLGENTQDELHQGPDGEPVVRHDPLVRLRGFRVRGDRGKGVEVDCDQLLRSLSRVSQEHGRVVDALGVSLPDDLGGKVEMVSIRGGRLTLGVENASTRHKLDRWLRSGGLDSVRDLAKVALKSVVLQIVQGPTD